MSEPEFYYVPDFPDYCVNKQGDIYSKRRGNKWVLLSQSINGDGYPMVKLYNNAGHITFKVHTVVMMTFVGELPAGMETRHLDGDKSNNCLENLKYDTHRENQLDSYYIHKTHIPKYGETCVTSVLTDNEVLEIRRLYRETNMTQQELAEQFLITRSNISMIVNYQSWKHLP